jgi:uncharacterized membrane protein
MDSMLPSLAGVALYGIVVFAIGLVVAYKACGKSVFGTSGHTSSELKLTLGVFAVANLVMVAVFVHGGTSPVIPVAALATMGVTVCCYIHGRSKIKAAKACKDNKPKG